MRAVAAATCSAPGLSRADRKRASASGARVRSLLTTATYRPVKSAMPNRTPPANPRFVDELIRVTSGYSRARRSAVPSVDALSTTTTDRSPGGRVWAPSASRQAGRRWAPFQDTTTARIGPAEPSADAVGTGAEDVDGVMPPPG